MIIENKKHKRLIEMTDDEIAAIVRGMADGNVDVRINNGRDWGSLGGCPITPNGVYRLVPKYTPITVDWSVLDDSIQWIAADNDGSVYGFSEKPTKDAGFWNDVKNYFRIHGIIKSLNRGDIPWDQSLIQRPEGV